MLWVLLEAPHRGASNEYPQLFLWRNKKDINIFGLKKYFICNYDAPTVLCLYEDIISGFSSESSH